MSDGGRTGEPVRFRELADTRVTYEGASGEILQEFLLPVVGLSVRYDRLTSFFNVAALLAVAEGLERLRRQGGRMRLVLGVHDVPEELALARVRSEEGADTVVRQLRARLLDEAGDLADELHRDRLAALAWMMRDGFLTVRVAVPLDLDGLATRGIFHSKRLVLEDTHGDRVSAVGSPNETVPGLDGNYEELTVHRSWNDEHGYVAAHARSFELLWANGRDDLFVRDLDTDFATELLSRLDRDESAAAADDQVATARAILREARRSPAFWPLNSGPVALYPHQERAVIDALSRWPVRVLLADEVGLGKTLEAGAILSYLLRFRGVRDAMVLAPAAVLRQWRDELKHHFGLDFWIYDSTSKSYVSPSGETVAVGDAGPLSDRRPNLTIVSAQLARGTRANSHAFSDAGRLPELLLLDEAHAARVRRDNRGHRRPTRLFRTMRDAVEQVPHVVLLTATPVQLDLGEYHALLELLGLPEPWGDLGVYQRSLEVLATGEKQQPGLERTRETLELIRAALQGFSWVPDDLEADQRALCDELGSSTQLTPRTVIRAKERWDLSYELLVRSHPAHQLTIRNARQGLEALGYSFPDRDLQAPIIDVPPAVAGLYGVVSAYLDDAYGTVERAIDPDGRHGTGFAKSSYHQRLVSSLHACRVSLARRLRRIEAVVGGLDDTLGSDQDPDDDEEETDSPAQVTATTDWNAVERAASIERTYIRDLLDRLSQFELEDHLLDPKMRSLIDILRADLPNDAVLVFSRYTDTLEACLRSFERSFPPENRPGYALYTGSEVWIDRAGDRTKATKHQVTEALDDGEVRVIFCSEAASEGLNLQTARVLVNVDVPWNPARLEQRIGRIARLGQRAPTVTIYNLWYPDSIEARIYSRLLTRQDLYQLAVGQFPELISQAIRESLASRFDPSLELHSVDPLAELQRLREEVQHRAIQRIWDVGTEPVPVSEELRTNLRDALASLVGEERLAGLTVTAGSRRPLTLDHDVLQAFDRPPRTGATGQDADLVVIDLGDTPVAFAVAHGSGYELVPATALSDLILAAVGSRPYPLRGDGPSVLEITDGIAEIRESSRWLPDHAERRTISEVPALLPQGAVGIRRLGSVKTEEAIP